MLQEKKYFTPRPFFVNEARNVKEVLTLKIPKLNKSPDRRLTNKNIFPAAILNDKSMKFAVG